MPSGEVHWHEGMFLRQHHFLTEHRRTRPPDAARREVGPPSQLGPALDPLNTEALGNFRFSVSSLKARLRDGTAIEVPEDGPLPDLDLKPAFEGNRRVRVYLGVPMLKPASPTSPPSVPPEGSAITTSTTGRSRTRTSGVNPQPIAIRRLNLKLLLSTEDLAGYETIPMARIEKSERAEATPQLDATYIPPVLACDAWRELSVGILQDDLRPDRAEDREAGRAGGLARAIRELEPVGCT